MACSRSVELRSRRASWVEGAIGGVMGAAIAIGVMEATASKLRTESDRNRAKDRAKYPAEDRSEYRAECSIGLEVDRSIPFHSKFYPSLRSERVKQAVSANIANL